jgi:restriction system protein
MKNYYRVMLGPKSIYADECFDKEFIGADFGISQDLTSKLFENWREFNHEFIPIYLESHPGKSRVTAGLACGALHTIAKGILVGDRVLSPDGTGHYRVGEVTDNYSYSPGGILPHRRSVNWLPVAIDRQLMSEKLRYSTVQSGRLLISRNTVRNLKTLSAALWFRR